MRNDDEAQSHPGRQRSLSHLFLVRVWTEPGSEEAHEVTWSGKVQHVKSGEAHNFHDWPALVRLLREMAGRWEVDEDDQ